MRLKNWSLPLTLVLFISGLLLVWALRALAASDLSPSHKKNNDLVSMIKSQERDIKEMENRIDSMRKALDREQRKMASGKRELEGLQSGLQKLKVLSGLTGVQGKGLVITLDDNRKQAEAAQAQNPSQFKPEDYLIHDKHLLYIVNELRVGGAEAIAINDQRIVNTSDIRCVGPMILVNTTRLAPPYTIKAIGDPDRMARVLALPESEYNILKMSGYPVNYEKQDNISLPPYKGSYQFTYARPKED